MIENNRTSDMTQTELRSHMENLAMLFTHLGASEKDFALRLVHECHAKVCKQRIQLLEEMVSGDVTAMGLAALTHYSDCIDYLDAAWQWKGTRDDALCQRYQRIKSEYDRARAEILETGKKVEVYQERNVSDPESESIWGETYHRFLKQFTHGASEAYQLASFLMELKLADGERTLH